MALYTLQITALGSFSGGNAPLLEVLVDGVVFDSRSMTGGASPYSFNFDFTGSFPSSISFRFSGTSGDPGDTITISSATVNGSNIFGGNNANNVNALLLQRGDESFDISGRFVPDQTDLGADDGSGTGGDDNLVADGTDNVVDLGLGDDRIYADSGDDAINGGDGNDRIFGGGGGDIIIGGAGDDRIWGQDGNDQLYGEDGVDRIIGGDGDDIINGGAGNDFLIGDAGADTIFGEDGDDRLIGKDGNDVLFGDAGEDILNGGNDDDIIFGGDDDDRLIGGGGDDMLDGGAGNDQIIGNDGIDTIDGEAGNDEIYGGAGADVIGGQDGTDTIYGEDGNDVVTGGNGDDFIIGGAGADTLSGNANDDLIYGHGLDSASISAVLSGNPGVVYNASTNSFYQYVSAPANYATAQANAAATSINGVTGHLVAITSTEENTFAFSLTGGSETWIGANDQATEGVWVYDSGPEGTLQFWQGNGGGTAVNGFFNAWQGGDPNNGPSGNADAAILNTSGLWFDRPESQTHGYIIEWEAGEMNDDDASDIIDGGAGDDSLYGNGGDDTIDGGTGADLIFGGSGDDTITAGSENDNVYGGLGNDLINGEDGDDILSGVDGDDTIIGGAGADTINGGSGDDIIHGHGVNDTVVQTILAANPDVVYSAETGSFYQLVDDGTNDSWTAEAAEAAATTLAGVGGHLATITSQTEHDFLIGNVYAGVNAFFGASDADTEGEWFWVAGAEDGLQFWSGATAASGGVPVNNAFTNWDATQPNDTLSGTPNQDYGYILNNNDQWADGLLNGGTGFVDIPAYIIEWEGGLFSDDNAVDTINGGAGDDMIYGWGGADILSGGIDNDTIFGGDGDDTLNGDAGQDTLLGGSNDDTINGGDGDDYLSGGTGIDILNGDDGDDTLWGGFGGDTLNGGDGADTLRGGVGNDILNGGIGNDFLYGDDDDDTLNGGDGDDSLYAGAQENIAVNASTLSAYGAGQDGGGTVTFLSDDVGVNLNGNNWKDIEMPYRVTASTVIEFDFRATIEAEISGIGFDNDDGISQGFTFELWGTQNWGIQAFNNYDGSGDWIHYTIDVGSYYTGDFNRLILVNDDDGNSPNNGTNGNAWFRNIVIHEGDTGESNTLNGEDGADNLYGSTGIDTFEFDNLSDIDAVYGFDIGEDILDLSDIITFSSGAITDYIELNNSGDHVSLSVDTNGASGGANFVDIGELRGQSDLDVAALYANGQILVS